MQSVLFANMTKSLLICTRLQVNSYERRGGQRDSTARVFNLKGEGVINIKILRKKIFVVEWSETTDMQTMFTQRTKIEVDLPLVQGAVFHDGVLKVSFKKGSARSMVGAQPWNREKKQRDKCQWLKSHTGPANLADACVGAQSITMSLHNTETKIRKDLRCILEKNVMMGSTTPPNQIQPIMPYLANGATNQNNGSSLQSTPSFMPYHHNQIDLQPLSKKRGSIHLEPAQTTSDDIYKTLVENTQRSIKKPRSLTQEESRTLWSAPSNSTLPLPQSNYYNMMINHAMNTSMPPSLGSNGIESSNQLQQQQLGLPSFPYPKGMMGLHGMPGFSGGLGSLPGMNGGIFPGLPGTGPFGAPLPINKLPVAKPQIATHHCTLKEQCQSCGINICGTCSVVAGCGCGPFCNGCFTYTDTCGSCGHTQCEHCVLNSLRGGCGCVPKPDMIKLEEQGRISGEFNSLHAGRISGGNFDFFADEWDGQ